MLQRLKAYQDFYSERQGRFVRKVLRKELYKTIDKKLKVLGVGYTLPFVKRDLNIIPSFMKCDDMAGLPNNVSFSDPHTLPIESNFYDQVMMVHILEHAEHPIDTLKEAWRVLKSGGKLVMIVSNRNGLWSRADHSPFGQGRPFSSKQIIELLKETDLACEDIRPALYFLPLQRKRLFKFAWLFEKVGKFLFIFPGGVHIVVAQKQIYSPVTPSRGTAVPVKTAVKPAVANSKLNRKKSNV